jgi:hypothetical protein
MQCGSKHNINNIVKNEIEIYSVRETFLCAKTDNAKRCFVLHHLNVH